jgi:hypothetical protein
LTGGEVDHVPVGRVERASYHFTPDNVAVPRCPHVSPVKFNYDDDDDDGNLHSFAIKALKNVTGAEIPPGLTARVDSLVASQVGRTFPFCSPLIVNRVQSETHVNTTVTVRP